MIVGPVGAYYKEGMNPVRILASDTHVRAVKGGLGAAKTMANYAASLYGADEAEQAGYTQVLWLDGVEHKYLDEVGTMKTPYGSFPVLRVATNLLRGEGRYPERRSDGSSGRRA